MSQPTLLRRHPYLALTGLLATGVALWVGYFLATFDLNDYRTQLAAKLSEGLQMPVQLGEARLALRDAGVAFSFSNLQIGNEQTPVAMHAEQLWLQLAWRGLLLKKPLFTEVGLDRPQLRISPRPQPAAPEPPGKSSFDLGLLADLTIRRFEIQGGALDLNWVDREGLDRALRLRDLSVNLGDLGLARTVTFDFAGTLPEQAHAAKLAMTGRVDLPADGAWREALWDFALEAQNLDAAGLAGLLPERAGIAAEGTADLALFVNGQLDTTVTVQADLSGQGLLVRPGTAYHRALPLRHLQFAGIWQRQEHTQVVRQVAVQLDEMRLAGEFTVNPGTDGTEITGALSNGTLPVDALRRWLPHDLQTDSPFLARLRPGGVVLVEQAALRAVLPALPQGQATVGLEALDAEVQTLAWSLGRERTVELQTLKLHLANGRWQVANGSGAIAGVPVAFAGTITPQTDAPPQFAFDLESSPTAEQLVELWPELRPGELSLAGPLVVRGQLAGTPETLLLAAQLDLAQLDLRYGEHLHLPPTPGALFSLQGQGNLSTLAIDQATLNLPPLNGVLSGTLDWTEALVLDLAAKLEIADLTAAYALAPALDKLQLRGGAVLDLTLSGPGTAIRPSLGLTLHDISIPTRGVIADISQLQGRLQLDGKELRSGTLTARLGNSPVTLQARVADLTAPQLELEVKAAAIRADELIFRSQSAVLRDLSAQLLIDREGIAFRPVTVRLDGGTRAAVRGRVNNFAAPKVDLDITGDYANVEEIIGLWTDENPAAKATRQGRPHADAAHFPAIRISVTAQEGDLYGMKFSAASALVVPGPERLLLHPLDFNVDEGYCTTQVLVDHAGDKTVLRVSGHLENVDAYAVHNQLLDRKSILRGRLRGDFYLQGELGSRGFLPTAFGNINITVRDGVMRHSPVLSTLFSLLNVSQLFQFKLPDINLEGLPFTLLTAELAIDNGVLSTEHLVIDSEAMNMSYAGQYDMVKNQLDLLVVTKPLGTIDKVVTRLPIAGWILGGEERALITAQFRVTGPGEKPDIEAIPISAISKGVLGIFQRTLGLPLKLIEDPAILWGGGGERKD